MMNLSFSRFILFRQPSQEKNATPLQAAVHQCFAARRRQTGSLPPSSPKGSNMLDEEYPMTCEDTCEDWFQEAPNSQEWTGESPVSERVQAAEVSKTCLTIDAIHRWPDALALKLGGDPRQANGRSGPGMVSEWHDGG